MEIFICIVLLLIVVLCISRMFWELQNFKVTEYEIKSDKLKENFKAVVVADLHCQQYGKDNEKLLTEIRERKPDVMFIPGDLIVCKGKQRTEEALAFLKEAVKICPVYYAPGNHEERLENTESNYLSQVKACGANYLDNEIQHIAVGQNKIAIAGLSIGKPFYKRGKQPLMTEIEMEAWLGKKPKEFCVLLAHNPEYLDAYTAWGSECVLSGHNHGGMVRLPLLGGVISPRLRLFDKFDRGTFRKDNTAMLLSAGLGMHTIKIRFLNTPELLVVNFRRL